MTVSRSALIIYSFAPKDLPNHREMSANAREYLRALWRGCDSLGINQALPNLKLSTEFPQVIDANNPRFRVLAAKVDMKRKATKQDYQAFLFEYQDIVGFVATLETNVEAESISGWKILLEQWTANSGGDVPDGVMEETHLFTCLHESNNVSSGSWLSDEYSRSTVMANLSEQVIQAMPSNHGSLWRPMTPYISNDGYCIWGGERVNGRRTVALVAPRDKKDELFSWTVWPGRQVLAPFARYLMHAAKLHFAQQVFENDMPSLHRESQQLDKALTRLVSLHQRAEERGLSNPHEINKAHTALAAEQTRNFKLLYGLSKLKELSLTTQIASKNMRQLVPQPYPGIGPFNGSMFQQDRARSSWQREQIEMDLGYLRALRQRVSEGHQIARLLLERQAENTSRRLKSLVLLQGTVIGSLTVGLLMIPAFEVEQFKQHHHLVWAALLLLMAIVLVLPVLFERWHERYTRVDRSVGGVLGASVLFLGVALWEFLARQHLMPAKEVSAPIFALFNLVAAFAGFVLGYLGVGLLEKFKSIRIVEPVVST